MFVDVRGICGWGKNCYILGGCGKVFLMCGENLSLVVLFGIVVEVLLVGLVEDVVCMVVLVCGECDVLGVFYDCYVGVLLVLVSWLLGDWL